MPCQGLVAWGAKLWSNAFGAFLLAFALGSLTVGCGSGEEKKRAVECQTDEDCDDSELGVCDSVSCEDHSCVVGTKPDGQKCNDEDPLTRADACLTGVCKGVTKVCEDDLGPCLMAVHDPETDECVIEPAPDGVPCDDEDACTQRDSCEAGECVGSEPKTCAASDDCHVDGECDPESGECSEALADDGVPCDDGQACTSDDVCEAGACAGEALTCDDGLACSVDACDEDSGACAADMTHCSCVTDADCSDDNACNGSEICNPDSKLCQLGEPVICATNSDPCLSNRCVPETGACEPEPAPDGSACDDGDACTTLDVCEDGQCSGAEPVVCTALSQCHTPGTCDPATGTCSNPEKAKNSPCNDGNACSATDTCQAGACVGSAPVGCKPSDQCHDSGVCNTSTGICSKPNKQNGVQCDDGSPCTTGDACQNGNCTPAAGVICTAADSCHLAGTCDAASGKCTNPAKPNGSSCSDGQTCTSTDVCNNGACGGTKLTCNDGIACTADSCSEKLGGCTTDTSACPCKTSADCDDKNPCNGVESCDLANLKCVSGAAVDCSALDTECSVGACDGATGKCVATPKADGTTCNDHDLCTAASSCQAGSCVGQNPLKCVASDQCHAAGSCNPATGACSNPALANGSACNDGNACTQSDSCQGGSCVGASPVACGAGDDCHNAPSCNASTGKCEASAKPNGTACSDGNACTQTDSCQGGVCSGANPVVCSASDQCHSGGACDTGTGKCSNPAKPDNTGCNDGNVCTQTDVCQKGLCTGTKPVTCAASDQCHSAGTCDKVLGCSNPVKSDGTTCSDGNACTRTDACSSGVCKGSSPISCTASDQCHQAGTCDPASGVCSNPSKTDGTACNDGKACTSADQCKGGVCGGAALSCDDKIACTADSCVEPSGCDNNPKACGCAKDADCDDKDACTGVEKCDLKTLTCVAGTKVSCSSLDDACNVGACDSATGACSAKPRTDGTACNDNNACTKSDGCVAGKCVGASPVTCTASDQCHDVGSCDKATGACSNPNKTNGSTCSDGNGCTTGDNCQSGVCTTTPVVCAAPDQCHLAGTCKPATGACDYPVKTGGCDDGDKCTQSDTCQAGVCKGTTKLCSASDTCHDAGSCDPKTGDCSNPAKDDGFKCDDGNKCTATDTCLSGKCTGSSPTACTPVECQKVSCNPASGACEGVPTSSGTACNDANACTSGETCDGKGNCSNGSAVSCPAVPECQVGSCDPTKGCTSTNEKDGALCSDDGSLCTLTDRCRAGVCIGTNKRTNSRGDWADDPGTLPPAVGTAWVSVGPRSVDTFTDGDDNVHVVGTYSGTIAFNDKDAGAGNYKTLDLPSKLGTAIYWAIYDKTGALVSLASLGGVTPRGALTVAHAASNKDGSFTLLGSLSVEATLGLGKTQVLTNQPLETFVARFANNGDLEWVALGVPEKGATVTPQAVANFDNGSVIAVGDSDGAMTFVDAKNEKFGSVGEAGVWAVELTAAGVKRWGQTVVFPGGVASARAVTTHDNGNASLTGDFTLKAGLGPKAEVSVAVASGENPDIWFQQLDSSGNLKWGGRVGGSGADVPGDLARLDGGALLLLANTIGSTPNASDAQNTQQLHVGGSGLQAHVLGIAEDGVLKSDGLIATNLRAAAAQGYQLKVDAAGAYAVAGTFSSTGSFWSNVGFGAGAPSVGADFTIKSAATNVGPLTLFLARVDTKSAFGWAVQAGGDNSGMATTPWNIVMTAHGSHAATVAGIFNATADFGDQKIESLTGAPGTVGNAFVVHLNSEAEYDYCP